jgi:hypothetical protein
VKPAWRSPGLVWRRGGQVATASRRWERNSEVAMFDLGEEGRRREMSAAKVGCHTPFREIGTKPPYVCPGCSNHTHGNNMINRCNVIKITSNSLT